MKAISAWTSKSSSASTTCRIAFLPKYCRRPKKRNRLFLRLKPTNGAIYEIFPGIIRSAERMTYTAVNAVLEGDESQRKRYAVLVESFELMRELALILNRKRERRGSIDFDLPEPVIEFDEFGLMKSITRS